MINGNPPPPAKKPLSCWLIGSLGCLTVCIIAGIAVAVTINAALRNPKVKDAFAKVGSIMSSMSTLPATLQKIQQAVVADKAATGRYPDTLDELVPTYLPDRSILHNGLDSNADPSHISYVYTKPAKDAPASTIILTYTWEISAIEQNSSAVDSKDVFEETLGGKMWTITYQNGKVIRSTNPDVSPSST